MAKRGSIDGVEVRGEVLIGTLEAMGPYKKRGLTILKRLTSIDEPKKGDWYPLHALVHAFDEVWEAGGALALRKIGASVAQTAVWPPGVDTHVKALALIDVAYHMNHRRDGKELVDPSGNVIEGFIGHDRVITTEGKREATYICESFYHCDFDYGMAEYFCKKFKPADSKEMTFRHDDSKPCRRLGGESCSYVVTW